MTLNKRKASILLAFVISARATSFMFSKSCLTTMTAFSLISLRFLCAAMILFLFFHRHILKTFDKGDLLKGFLFGTLYFLTLFCEHMGLKTTNSGTASFLENMAIIIVPFAEAFLTRHLPGKKTLLRAFLAMSGILLLTMKDGLPAFSSGEGLLLCAAGFYAAAIIVTSRMSRDGDSFNMGFFQVCTIASWGTVSAFFSGKYTLPSSGGQVGMIFVLAAVCTCFGFTLQPVAQSKLSSETSALFCALSPMVAGLLGMIFLQESLTPFSFAGEVLILISLLIR